MKSNDDLLQRLFRAAGRVPQDEPAEPPAGFESRVLASWRCTYLADDSLWFLGLFRRAVVAAWVVAFLSVVVSYESLPEPGPSELTQADLAIKRTLLP
jgi:hypothetical protein